MTSFDSNYKYEGKTTFFQCFSCGMKSPIHIPQKLELFACPKCSVLHLKSQLTKYAKFNNQSHGFLKYFPLGAKGTYEGETYTVIGNAHKFNKANQYDKWEEIVLLDTKGDISFLNCSYGNYTWMKPVYDLDKKNFITIEDKSKYNGKSYRFFMRYKAATRYCRGEFPYDPVDLSKIECMDYIAPPYAISIERSPNGVTETYHGTHMSRRKVSEMFDDPRILLQSHEGIGFAQPVMGNLNLRTLFNGILILTAILIVSSIVISSGKPSGYFFDKQIVLNRNGVAEPEFVSKSFTLADDPTLNYLEFESTTSLSNEWVEVALTLVNEKTGEEREFGIISEYYSGVDDGYSWSEGSNSGNVSVASVPGGRYHIKGKIYTNVTDEQGVSITGQYSSPVAWNLGFSIIPLFILYAILAIMNHRYDSMRSGEIDNLFDSGT